MSELHSLRRRRLRSWHCHWALRSRVHCRDNCDRRKRCTPSPRRTTSGHHLKGAKRVAQLFALRGNIKASIGTKLLYGVSGAFYFCMPLCLILTFHKPIEIFGWRVVAIALVWVLAAFHLFGLCVTYNFESGVVKCLWFGRDVMWQERLDTLKDVETSVARGLVTIYLVWPDHRRRLWLRESD